MVRVQDIFDYMHRTATWVDWNNTVDGVIVGNAAAAVTQAGVAWIPSMDALREAVRMGCQLFMTHEPTLYSHKDELDHMAEWPGAEDKRRFIQDNGLTVLRNHDTWDGMPEVGIPWSWAAFLGLHGEPFARTRHLQVYPVSQMTLEELAVKVAERTALIGEPTVQMIGDPDQMVTRVGVGTGCGCSPLEYRRMGADAGIVCDDGTTYWQVIQWAADQDFGIVRVNHCTSEEPGVAAMAKHFSEQFPQVHFNHIRQGCRFRLMSTEN